MPRTATPRPSASAPRRRTGSLLLTVLMLLPLLATAGPAGARDARAQESPASGEPRPTDLRDMAALLAEQRDDTGGGERTFADAGCVVDPTGDTFRIDEEGEEVATDFPRADIVEHCADYGDALRLRLRVAEPTDPATDPLWRGQSIASASRALWFLGDGEDFPFVASLRHDGERPVLEVIELGDAETEDEVRCTGTPALVDRFLDSGPLDPAVCFGMPDQLVIAPVMAYDEDPDDPEAPVHLDIADTPLEVSRPLPPAPRQGVRLSGAGRADTAMAIAQDQFPDGADIVYLARSDTFPDALAAGSLSPGTGTRGPVLLVPRCGALPPELIDEIARLNPSRVTALGGTVAICNDVLRAAAQAGRGDDPADARRFDRLSGRGPDTTRFGTAVAISQRAYPVGRVADVYLASGQAFPDALSAGPLTDGPILLIPSCGSIPGVVLDEIERLDPVRIVALGGRSAICSASLLQAAEAADGSQRDLGRLEGATRLQTAIAVARFQFPTGAEVVALARADAFPDALAAAPIAGGPVLLVPPCGTLPPDVAQVIRDLDPARVLALGGESAVCDAMLQQAVDA